MVQSRRNRRFNDRGRSGANARGDNSDDEKGKQKRHRSPHYCLTAPQRVDALPMRGVILSDVDTNQAFQSGSIQANNLALIDQDDR